GSLARNTLATEVSAGISAAEVTTTTGNVDIAAASSFDVEADGLGFSIAGLVGGVGTATLNELTNATKAFIDGGAIVDSAAAVRREPEGDCVAAADGGGSSAGIGMAGAGLSFASSMVVNDVQAIIDGEATVVVAAGALLLQATYTPDVAASALG